MEQTLRFGHRTAYEWLAALPAFLVLVFVVVLNTSGALHAQLLKLGETIWSGYYELRVDPVQPSCNPNMDIDAELVRLIARAEAEAADDFLFAAEPVNPEQMRQSLLASQQQCAARFERYQQSSQRITLGVEVFRWAEKGVASIGEFGLGVQRIMLAILVLICSLTTLYRRHHIALRPMETAMDHRVASGVQTLANIMLFYSLYSFKEVAVSSGVAISEEHALLHNLWIVGFAAIMLLSFYQLLFIPKDAKAGGNILSSLLAVPVYAYMCLISGSYFIFIGHGAGIGIYLNQMMELSQLFLNVGLYVWIGMLLKRTELAQKVFDVFRPFKLPPEILAVVVVAIAAIPTAYTGASGIFVIAIGGLIYSELRRSGARRQLALAATAMSGSTGVVLRPCLLVIIIAALNSEVTTDQLFGWGIKVFLLSIIMFAGVALLTRQDKTPFHLPEGAFAEFVKALKPLLPYVILIGLTLGVYALLLNAYLDEFSAPFILPVLLLLVLIYERIAQEKAILQRENQNIDYLESRLEESWDDLVEGRDSLEKTVREATTEAIVHIGALLMLMGLSVSIGGVLERAEVMSIFPMMFDSVWYAMLALVVILIAIGMVMDPYGAVILVSATLAGVAYQNGIDPVHFWMVTLVAFELGYLTPPVSLNHLLTRQVVGEEEVRLSKEDTIGQNYWCRHEKILLPITAVSITLALVAFVPLLIAY